MNRKFESTYFRLKVILFIIVFSLGTSLILIDEGMAELNNSIVSINFSQPPQFEISVNGSLIDSNCKIITVKSSFDIPHAFFVHSPPFPTEEDTVTFDASDSSDFDGTISSFDWDFGDETTGTGKLVSHSYSAGRYTVVLTVTDNDGNQDTEIKNVDVKEVSSTPNPPLDFQILFYAILGFFIIVIGLIIMKVILPTLKKWKSGDVIPSLAKKSEEELKSTDMIHLKEMKEFPRLSDNTIALLKGYIEDPSPTNDRKAWKGFRELTGIVEQSVGEFAELMAIRNAIALLRRNRDEDRRCGRDELADESESDIQNNYVESIRIIKEIQKNLL